MRNGIPSISTKNLAAHSSESPLWSVKLPLSTNSNPYALLPDTIINEILSVRDTNPSSNTSDGKMRFLQSLDNVFPEWKERILASNNVMLLGSWIEMLFYGACKGINFRDSNVTMTPGEVGNYISLILELKEREKKKKSHKSLKTPIRAVRYELIMTLINVPPRVANLITLDQAIQVITTGAFSEDLINKLLDMEKRLRQITLSPYKAMISELYGAPSDLGLGVVIRNGEKNPIEDIILDIDIHSNESIIETFGIHIPIRHSSRIREYILDNITWYKNLYTREGLEILSSKKLSVMPLPDISRFISKLSDQEIFDSYHCFVPYNSRRELVDSISSLFLRESFFYPITRRKRCSINKETLMYNDVDDTETFMLCHGTVNKFHTYEIEELINAFSSNDSGITVFIHPYGNGSIFPPSDILSLRKLLEQFPLDDPLSRLLYLIDKGLKELKDSLQSDAHYIASLKSMREDQSILVKQFLLQLFNTGMYMRRWKGPGNPYPVKGSDTRTFFDGQAADKEENDTNDIVSREMLIGRDMLNRMSPNTKNFCMSLLVCNYNNDGTIIPGLYQQLGDLWNSVMNGAMCIRMASSNFVGTAYRYNKILFRDVIPNFDASAVERIT